MVSVGALPIQVFVVAPPLVCWGLERLIHTAVPRLELVGTAATLAECMAQLERHLPDVVVLDLDDGYGADAVEELYERTRAKTLVLTSSTDPMLADRLVKAGARGVLRKREAPAMLLKTVEKVNDGELCIDQASTERLFMEAASARSQPQQQGPDRLRIAALTLRERQTIAAVASDASAPAKVIAGRLCISEHTLRNHLTSIYSKLGLSNRLDLYAFATKHELNKGVEGRRL